MQSDWREVYLEMLDGCLRRFGHLSVWEQDFTGSLRRQFDKPRFVISERQVKKLEGIWAKVAHLEPTDGKGTADLFGKS